MKILVTGHKGFIGSYVFNHLKTIGHQVSGIDFPDDIVDFEGGDYDVIIHLAAFAALRDSFENADRFWEKLAGSEAAQNMQGWECKNTTSYIGYGMRVPN